MRALGYVECLGLSGAIVAADKMLKTAEIELKTIQNTKGNGWITLEIAGDIAAVKVAVDSVKQDLPKVFVSAAVFGSPAPGLESLGATDVFQSAVAANANNHSDTQLATDPKSETSNETTITQEPSVDSSVVDSEVDATDVNENTSAATKTATCNLCGDPNCPRKLGEPHKMCIHYDELNNK